MWLVLTALAFVLPVMEDVGQWTFRRGLEKVIEHGKLGHAFDLSSGK